MTAEQIVDDCGCAFECDPDENYELGILSGVIIKPCDVHNPDIVPPPDRAGRGAWAFDYDRAARRHLDAELDWRVRNASRRLDVRAKKGQR